MDFAQNTAGFSVMKWIALLANARADSGVKDEGGFSEPEHVEAGVAIATPDGNKE